MKIVKAPNATNKGSADWFTGDVYVDSIAVEGSGISAAVVHFTPGARTAWHVHDHGQTIFITEGIGYVQREGGAKEEVRAGDMVFFEPGENHWHGASSDRLMTHVAMLKLPESGPGTHWGVHVSDDEYSAE